jgi:hypothetical protein
MKSDVPKMLFSFFPDTSSGSRLDKKETKNQARLTCRQGFASSGLRPPSPEEKGNGSYQKLRIFMVKLRTGSV